MAFLLGVSLALAGVAAARGLDLDRDRAAYPALLAAVASAQVLFAVMSGSIGLVMGELAIAIPFFALAQWGLQMNLWWVVAGLAVHGLVDAVHAQIVVNPAVPLWWPAAGAGGQIAAALALGVLLAVPQRQRVLTAAVAWSPGARCAFLFPVVRPGAREKVSPSVQVAATRLEYSHPCSCSR